MQKRLKFYCVKFYVTLRKQDLVCLGLNPVSFFYIEFNQ